MDSGLLDSLTLPSGRPAETPVKVWLLLGKYGGDNAQVRALGDHLTRRLGWSCETRRIHFYHAHKVVREKFPDAIDFDRSDSLTGPLPDVVVSCGRFYGMVGAWLKEKSAQATGRRMVHAHLGRIAAPMSSFDLIAAMPQYGLPAAPNFIPLTLPFVLQDPARTEAAIAAWTPRLSHLPRPWTVLLTGGPIPQIPIDDAGADQIADQAIAHARAAGGSLILAVSRRTPGPLRERMAGRIAAAGLPFWSVGYPAPEPNPYPALLAQGDHFIVTSDSTSMIADVCVAGKPLELTRLPIAGYVNRFSSRGLGLSIDARRRRRARAGKHADLLDRLRDTLVARNWMQPWEEIRDSLHALETHGLLAKDAGDRARRIQAAELDACAARIARLVAAAGRAAPDPVKAPPIAAEAA